VTIIYQVRAAVKAWDHVFSVVSGSSHAIVNMMVTGDLPDR
jgi:hypothetical protein